MEGLKSLRKASGLSQFTVANRAGIDRSRLSLAENGHVKLNLNEERAVRRVLLTEVRKRLERMEEMVAFCGSEPIRVASEREIATMACAEQGR